MRRYNITIEKDSKDDLSFISHIKKIFFDRYIP